MKKAERSGLPFFGIGKIIPYLARYKKRVYAMLFCGIRSFQKLRCTREECL